MYSLHVKFSVKPCNKYLKSEERGAPVGPRQMREGAGRPTAWQLKAILAPATPCTLPEKPAILAGTVKTCVVYSMFIKSQTYKLQFKKYVKKQ